MADIDLDVALDSKKKAYREDFVTKPRLSTAHLRDWINKQAQTCRELAGKVESAEASFGHSKKARAYEEVLEHIRNMSNK